MSTSSHLSRNLATLIRTIGQTRSKQQQDEIIRSQISYLKSTLTLHPKESDFFEMLIKLIYIETLGHDGSFLHIHAVNLCQSRTPKIKRLGYLLTNLCINRNSKMSILMLSTIQKDLTSTNLNNLIYALTALPKILNKTIIQGVLQELKKLLKHPTDLVRKKTLLVLHKVYMMEPEMLPTFKTILQEALFDEEPPVCFVAVNIIQKLASTIPEQFKDNVQDFCRILKDIVIHKYPKEYDFHKVPAPWMQISILRLLECLGKNDAKSSSKMYDVLEKTLRRATYNQMHINNAIVVQAVTTISSIYPNMGLLRECEEFMWRFFEKDNNNLRCFGINTLAKLVKVQPTAVQTWQYQILECLESQDTTLASATVELLINIAHEQNTQIITQKLIDLAQKETDPLFQINLIRKSFMLIERFSANPEVYTNHMNQLFLRFQNILDDKSINSYINVLKQTSLITPDFSGYLVEQYSMLIRTHVNSPIMRVGAWIIGQYGPECFVGQEKQRVNQLVDLLLEIGLEPEARKNYHVIVPALLKLSKAEGFNRSDGVRDFLLDLERNKSFQVYQTAEEYIRLSKFGPALKKSTDLAADPTLSFLDAYIDTKELKTVKIRRDYHHHQKNGEGVKLLVSVQKDKQDQKSLNLNPYPTISDIGMLREQRAQNIAIKNNDVAIVEMDNQSILKFNGPRKWTQEGYLGKKTGAEKPVEPNAYVSQSYNKEGEFRPRGPQERKKSDKISNLQTGPLDQKKLNLAKSIFTHAKF